MIGMVFETTARLFFGNKADHIAGLETDHSSRKRWLSKLNKRIINSIDSIDTTERHKRMLMLEAEEISNLIKSSK